MREQHLTEDEVADLLVSDRAGGGDGDAREHLRQCAPCRTDLEEVQRAIGSFNAVSLKWAEREAPRRVRVPEPPTPRRYGQPVWSAAAAVVVAAAVLLGVHERRVKQASAPEAATYSAAAIAADNLLLQAIDRELQVQHESPVPVAELGITDANGSRASSKEARN